MHADLIAHFEEYAAYHRHPMNRLTHKIAIPLIVFHMVAMLDWIPLWRLPLGFHLTAAHLVYVGVVAWYASLDLRLARVMAIAYGVCFPLGWITPKLIVVLVAVFAWIIQLAGHVVWEKKQPAFLKNIVQAFVGPLFFAAVLLGEWPLKSSGDPVTSA